MTYNFKNVRVLVVESSPEMAKLLKNVLQMLSIPEANIDMALSPEEAIIKFSRQKHDLIITDWLDNPDRGLKLTRNIRSSKSTPNPFVPVIMTAGSGHVQSVIKARDVGVSDYVIKPFSAKMLADRIVRVIEDKRGFVISDGYVGPDRRYQLKEGFDGAERRDSD